MEAIVSESEQSRFTQKIVIGTHTLTVDEPIKSGGNDLGPSPYDFLLAALGSCTPLFGKFPFNFGISSKLA